MSLVLLKKHNKIFELTIFTFWTSKHFKRLEITIKDGVLLLWCSSHLRLQVWCAKCRKGNPGKLTLVFNSYILILNNEKSFKSFKKKRKSNWTIFICKLTISLTISITLATFMSFGTPQDKIDNFINKGVTYVTFFKNKEILVYISL